MRRVFKLFLISGLACVAVACTDKVDGDQPDIKVETPVNGDYVRIHLNSDADNLNPYLSVQANTTFIKEFIYSYLLQVDPVSRKLVPQLAASLPVISPNGREFSFEIREDAKWDNGDPITAEDYIFTLKVIFNTNLPIAAVSTQYNYIDDVVIDSTNNKKFTVFTNELNFRSEYSVGGFELLSHKFYDPKGLIAGFSLKDIKENPKTSTHPQMVEFANFFQEEKFKRDPDFIYGSGPYKLEKWEPGQHITLIRKDNYWAEGLDSVCWCHSNYPQKLIFTIINDPQAAILALKNEELDLMKEIPSEEFVKFQEGENLVFDKFDLYTPNTMAYTFLGLNCRPPVNRKGLFTDAKVRRAFAHLVDVDRLNKDVYLGFGERLVGPVLPNTPEANSNLKLIDYNLDKAKELLDEAGWKDTNGNGTRDKMIGGKLVEFEAEIMVPKGSTAGVKLVSTVAQACEPAGIKIILREIPFAELGKMLPKHDFDIFGLGFSLPPLLPDFKQVYHSENWANGGTNYFGFGNAESDSLIDAIRVELDAAKRKPMYDRFQEILYNEQPLVFLRTPKDRMAIAKRFRNVVVTEVRPGVTPNGWWVPLESQKFPENAPAN